MKNDLFLSPCPWGIFSWYNNMKTWQAPCVRWHCMLMKNISAISQQGQTRWYLERRRKEIGWGVEVGLQGSRRLLVITCNLPRPTCMTRAFKNVWQIPQMRDRAPKHRGGKKLRMKVEFAPLVWVWIVTSPWKNVLFLMSLSLQD